MKNDIVSPHWLRLPVLNILSVFLWWTTVHCSLLIVSCLLSSATWCPAFHLNNHFSSWAVPPVLLATLTLPISLHRGWERYISKKRKRIFWNVWNITFTLIIRKINNMKGHLNIIKSILIYLFICWFVCIFLFFFKCFLTPSHRSHILNRSAFECFIHKFHMP